MKTERCQCGGLKTKCSARCLGCYSRRLSAGESAFNAVWNDYVQQSRRRNREWALTKDGARKLFESSCFYCGAIPSVAKTIPKGQGSFVFNGLDRVDNSKGYQDDNCVPCCRICNFMKRAMGVEEFLAHIHRIAKEHPCLT
jgi:5-methylcytosine-specific restriction endonuclease McrA